MFLISYLLFILGLTQCSNLQLLPSDAFNPSPRLVAQRALEDDIAQRIEEQTYRNSALLNDITQQENTRLANAAAAEEAAIDAEASIRVANAAAEIAASKQEQAESFRSFAGI